MDIRTPDKKIIYGTLRGRLKESLIIFVHGLISTKEEHQFYNGARFFEKNGLSSYRFNLYDWRESARSLEECTLSLHAKDLDTVISHFRGKGVKNFYLVGHSAGGLVVLLSKERVGKAVLWDCTFDPGDITDDAVYVKELGMYYFQYAYGTTIGKKMYEENKNINAIDLVKNVDFPIKFINAGAGVLVEGGKKMYEVADEPKERVVIEGADHSFDKNGVEEKLFEETLRWFRS